MKSGFDPIAEDPVFKMKAEIDRLRAENARLQSEVDALRGPHNDEIWHLTQERDSARGTVSMWIEANGPGGWIDKLRSDLQRHKQALEKARVALIPFQCETCNGTHKFKFECPSCLSGEGSCTCATQPEEPCPQCQSDNGLKEVYANLEGALRHIDEVLK